MRDSLLRRRLLFIVPLVLFGLLNVFTQQYYVDRSRAVPSRQSATFVEIPDASASHLLDEFEQLRPLARNPSTIFISDTFNIVYAKIENFYTRPAKMIFPSDDFLRANFSMPTNPFLIDLLIPAMEQRAMQLSGMRKQHFREPFFLLKDSHGLNLYDGFFADSSVPDLERHPENVYVLADTANQSVFNRRSNNDVKDNFQIIPLNDVHDHLIFIGSTYGFGYYARSQFSALFQLEPDIFYDRRTMAGIGRRLLLNVIKPDKKIRLELWFTDTLKDDGECRLYAPFVLGEHGSKQTAELLGRGSARVFLPPIEPRMLVGQPYILLDMGVNGTVFPTHRSGLEGLYGRHVLLDSRKLTAFARDISAISEGAYQKLRPPSVLDDIAKNLLDPDLEYSGAYEDGWISEASQYVLSHPKDSSVLIVRGLVPLIGDPNYHSTLRVVVGDRQIGRTEVGVGTFSLEFPVPAGLPARANVKVFFGSFQRLPNGDGRPVAMKMYTLGFFSARNAARSVEATTLSSRQRSAWFQSMSNARIDFGAGWYPVETYAGRTFRWANNDARIDVRAVSKDKTRLMLDVEPGPGEGGRPGMLHFLDGRGHELASVMLVGRQTVVFPLPKRHAAQTYILHIDRGGSAIPSDPRILDFRVFAAALR